MLLGPLDIFLKIHMMKSDLEMKTYEIYKGRKRKTMEKEHFLNNIYMTDTLLGAFR